jgi:hypothetical protein
MEPGGVDEKQATRILRRSDRDSAGFIRSFFDVEWDDPALYDLVINTRKLSLDMGVHMILEFIRSPDIEEGKKKAEEKLMDIALLQKVEATLLGILGVEVRHINIQAEGGRVILRGAVGSAMEKGNCEKSVAGIEGVREVDNQLFVTEHFRFGG